MSSVFEALASFSRPARGSTFYNVPLKEGLKFDYELEPFNARDENSIVLMSVADCHLARKALAHLLQKDFLPMGEFCFIFNVGFNDQTSSESEQFPK